MDYFDELKVMDSRGTICAGITRETLKQYESLFRREGLRWPYDRHGGTHPDLSGMQEKNGILVSHLFLVV